MCVCVCVCVCVYNIFFSHLSIDGHLGCFHILAIVNNTAMNMEVHAPFQTSVFIFLDKCPDVELLGHMVVQHVTGFYGNHWAV